jgi:hypothetical protein
MPTVPKPSEDDGSGFSKAGGDVDELGLAGAGLGEPSIVVHAPGAVAAGEPALIVIRAGRSSRGFREECNVAHAQTVSDYYPAQMPEL